MENLQNIQEERLVDLLKSKDKMAFEYLYNNYSGAVFGVLLKMLRNQVLAEDTLQEVFLKIWRNIEQFDSTKGKLYTWILNITRNAAIDKIRSKSYKQQEANKLIEGGGFATVANDYVFSIQQQTDAIGLESWVDKLKKEHQVIVELIYFKGYTQAEVSDKLQIPLGTVKTRVKSAINHLRELIK